MNSKYYKYEKNQDIYQSKYPNPIPTLSSSVATETFPDPNLKIHHSYNE